MMDSICTSCIIGMKVLEDVNKIKIILLFQLIHFNCSIYWRTIITQIKTTTNKLEFVNY